MEHALDVWTRMSMSIIWRAGIGVYMEILADFISIGVEAALLRSHQSPLSKGTRNVNGYYSLIRGFLDVCGGRTRRIPPFGKVRLHCIWLFCIRASVSRILVQRINRMKNRTNDTYFFGTIRWVQ